MDAWIVVPFVVGLLGAILVDVTARILFDRYKSPRLEICEDKPNGPYHSIKIKNTGRTAAKNCIGSIYIEVKNKDDIQDLSAQALSEIKTPSGPPQLVTELTERGISGSVCWAHSSRAIKNPYAITINSYDSTLLDVYRYLNGLIEIPSERGWETLRTRLKAKEYKGKLTVTGANAKRQVKDFHLKLENQNVLIEFMK